jgi:Ca2+-binding EF-hand superfamily protein
LLSLCLADGDRLVTQVMPTNLLEQSRNVLRRAFSSPIMPKRIFTFTFSRGVDDNPQIVQKLEKKMKNTLIYGDIIIAAPESIKSFFLKFTEQMHSLESFNVNELKRKDDGRENDVSTNILNKMKLKSSMSDCQLPIFDMMNNGVLLMDECDVLLHPLRSELNFPIGHKYPIDLSGYRWELPIFLLDALFSGETGKLSVNFQPKKSSTKINIKSLIVETSDLLKRGFRGHAFMRAPHIVLLDNDFYHKEMKLVMAKWSYLWLTNHFIGPCDMNEKLIIQYIMNNYADEKEKYIQLFQNLSKENIKLLNLTNDWLQTILPHCLTKINRVSFGLLTPADLLASSKTMPYTRKVLAVPFVGKDVPSRASEFAHPDVLIGLSILAYKYSGLRKLDLQRLITQLKHDYSRQTGPRNERPAALLFRRWLKLAVEYKNSNMNVNERNEETKNNVNATSSSITTNDDVASISSSNSIPVLPLPLFQPTDPQQLNRLYSLTKKLPQIIHYFLCNHIFPKTMNFQRLKVSACGHALGSSILFKTRLAFSGTPSNLLPKDLGICQYEPGSEGRIIYTLTNSNVVSAKIKNKWNAQSLLKDVAKQNNPPANVLIDTGALITGMDNREVAEFLLLHLREDVEGVVYLDRDDKKCILMREGGRSVGLEQCGTSPESYFTFYDQVHTTGMDIKQAPTAHAIVTVGKDMTFRDYAQGCYRMRGIGQGQTIELYVIPEVNKRIDSELFNKKNNLIIDVPSWLILNSMRMESLQFIQLQLQELHNGWRKQAFKSLLNEVRLNYNVHTQSRNSSGLRRFIGDNDEKKWLCGCVQQFREIIGFPIKDEVPEPQRFVDTINHLVEENCIFVSSDDERTRIENIKKRVQDTTQLQHVDKNNAASNDQATQLQATVVQEQSKEQEEEAQKQVQQVKVKQSAFARDDEDAHPWKIALLASCNPIGSSSAFNEFRTFTTRKDIKPVIFPSSLLLTDNFYRTAWVGLGDRRLKNVGIIMEWVPIGTGKEDELMVAERKAERMDMTGLDFETSTTTSTTTGEQKASIPSSSCSSPPPAPPAPVVPIPAPNWKLRMGVIHQEIMKNTGQSATVAAVAALNQIKIEMAQYQAKNKAFAKAKVDEEARIAAEKAEEAAKVAKEVKEAAIAAKAAAKAARIAASKRKLEDVIADIDWSSYPPIDLNSGSKSSSQQPRRYFVALTLAEGETIRRLLHDHAQQPVLKYCGIALRTSEGAILDVSPRFPRSLLSIDTSKDTQVDIQCLRFFNSEMYFTESQLTSLSRALHLSPVSDRLALFEETLRLREREKNNWSDTPVAKIFTREEDWHLMQGRSALNRLNAMFSSIAQNGGTLAESTLVRLFASEKQKEARLHSKESSSSSSNNSSLNETKSNRLAHEWTPSELTICDSVFLHFDQNNDGKLSVEDLHRLGVALRLKFDVQDCVELVKLIVQNSDQTVTKEHFLNSIISGNSYAHLPASCSLGTAELTNLDWWSCQQCQFLNAALNDICVVCQCDWSGVRSIPQGYWSCEGCTKLNADNFFYCEICGLSKKTLSTMKF